MEEHIFKPANLSSAFYWTGGQGMQPEGLRENVLPMPGYYATYEGNQLCFFMQFCVALCHSFSQSSITIGRSGALQQTFYGSPPACPVLGSPPPRE